MGSRLLLEAADQIAASAELIASPATWGAGTSPGKQQPISIVLRSDEKPQSDLRKASS